VKASFATASIVGDCIVFNIGGNKYRLITRSRYATRNKEMTYDSEDEVQPEGGGPGLLSAGFQEREALVVTRINPLDSERLQGKALVPGLQHIALGIPDADHCIFLDQGPAASMSFLYESRQFPSIGVEFAF